LSQIGVWPPRPTFETILQAVSAKSFSQVKYFQRVAHERQQNLQTQSGESIALVNFFIRINIPPKLRKRRRKPWTVRKSAGRKGLWRDRLPPPAPPFLKSPALVEELLRSKLELTGLPETATATGLVLKGAVSN